jgi:hypothetical protein
MRTTLDLDDDVLEAAKERARREGKTTGRLVSELLRRAMTQTAPGDPLVVANPPSTMDSSPSPRAGRS